MIPPTGLGLVGMISILGLCPRLLIMAFQANAVVSLKGLINSLLSLKGIYQ
jgi:hypothetical protein